MAGAPITCSQYSDSLQGKSRDHSSHGTILPIVSANARHAQGADPLLDAYSAFATPYSPSPSSADASSSSSPLTQYLRSNGILRLVLCGIATDVCVKATARDALRAGFEVILVESAVAGVDKVNSQTALEELRSLGATVVEDPTDLKAFLER